MWKSFPLSAPQLVNFNFNLFTRCALMEQRDTKLKHAWYSNEQHEPGAMILSKETAPGVEIYCLYEIVDKFRSDNPAFRFLYVFEVIL
jgi:hypothetical protein